MLTATLTDANTGAPIDLSDSLTTIAMDFRKAGTTAVTVIAGAKVGDGTGGQASFLWPTGSLAGTPGDYEAQIVISYNGQLHTVYDLLKFTMRANFGV